MYQLLVESHYFKLYNKHRRYINVTEFHVIVRNVLKLFIENVKVIITYYEKQIIMFVILYL